MTIGCQISEKCAVRPLVAQLDCELAAPPSAGDWLDRVVSKFRSAIVFQVPVGYQDETGFHCGMHYVPERIAVAVPNRENNLERTLQF